MSVLSPESEPGLFPTKSPNNKGARRPSSSPPTDRDVRARTGTPALTPSALASFRRSSTSDDVAGEAGPDFDVSSVATTSKGVFSDLPKYERPIKKYTIADTLAGVNTVNGKTQLAK